MKIILKITFLIFITLTTNNIFAQAPSSLPISFTWGQSAGGTEWDNNFRTVVDSDGNIYTLGFTYSPIFNYVTDNSVNDDISSNTGSSVYLIKYDPSGNLVWKKIYNANTSDERLDLTLNGNSIVWAAGFKGTQSFGDSTFTSSNSGASNSLVFVNLDRNGDFNWATQLNVDLAEYASVDLYLDNSGNTYFSTAFEGTISTVSGNYSSSGIGNDIIFGKLNPNGNVNWVNRIGNNEDDLSGNIILDKNGDILLTGRFTGSLAIGSNNLSSPVGYDWFMAKFNPSNGNTIWAISEGALGSDDRISAIAVNPWNEIIITGRYAASFTFGNQAISTVANDDIFVAKYSSSGSFIWVKTFGTSGENDWTSNNIGVDDAGTIWVESSVGGDNNGQNYPVFYGSAGDSLNLAGNQDFVFSRYSNSGDLLSINSYGTAAYEFTQDYYFDPQNGKSYIVGHHTSDTTIFNQDTLPVRGGFADAFVAVVEPNLLAKNDNYTVNSTSMQMIMVLMNDIYPSGPTLSIIENANHGAAFVMGGNHIAYTASGNYNGNDTIRYRICTGNECDEALLIINNVFSTAVSNIASESDFSIFPNPSKDFFTLSSISSYFGDISVLNALGQEIYFSEYQGNAHQISIADWTAGIYTVQFIDKNNKTLKSFKLIKL